MKPCGLILTFMSRDDFVGKSFWVKVRTLFFNVCLFVFQLIFMVAATVYGKVKWEKALASVKVLAVMGVANGLFFTWYSIFTSRHYWLLPIWIFSILYFVCHYRNIDWRRVWRAAQCSHVRLVLEPARTLDGMSSQYFWVMNFGYKYAEIQIWDTDWNALDRFESLDPTFPTPPEFMQPVIQYAHDQVGKRYDEVQLLSPAFNFSLWLTYPPCWGQEKIKWFNRPGGLEYCISGLTACLRWGENAKALKYLRGAYPDKEYCPDIQTSKYFPGYDTAVIPTCLAELSKNWRRE